MDQQIWQWTLTKDAIAPCFVRDVLDMRQLANSYHDFFWLGYTPCRTVLLVGMVVAVQNYDKRAIYTIDDGTAVIDCVLRHPQPTLHPHPPPRSAGNRTTNSNAQRPSPKKQRVDKAKALESMEPPPPITEPGYPVRVVGKIVRHYKSKQIHADSIDLCPSSLDEITHLERVINLHKTKYSLAVPFVLPPKHSLSTPSDTPAPQVGADADASVFSNTSLPSRPGSDTIQYTLPAPRMPMPLQDRNRPPPLPAYAHFSYHGHTHVPSSPTASSIVSSTPSSPCKPSSPVKAHVSVPPRKPKLRHPSRLHTRDLTSNTFRLYLKHYMDNGPPLFSAISRSSPCRNTCTGVTTPTKRTRRSDDEDNEPTPRPSRGVRMNDTGANDDVIQNSADEPTLGFTLSHLRRVPELALLASRVVRAEQRKREKAERDKKRANAIVSSSTSVSSRSNGRHGSAPSANGRSSRTSG
ncbi:hypothetical protein JVU11DRAFT_5927 [Chiua virens]|nr:hypothetical protein JVU11DRAFT_5927 [Chiua virens]